VALFLLAIARDVDASALGISFAREGWERESA
jgi:hypothetical protein